MSTTAEPWREWDILGERSGSRRFPKIPRREDLDSAELPDWDQFQVRYEKIQRDKYQLKFRHRIAGGFFGLMCSPPLASALTVAGRAVGEQQGKPGRYTAADHEFIDLVLSFDSGHWGLLANHTPFAVASGIPVSTVRALRDGRLGDLSDDDRQVVAFVRAVRDGTVDDAMWQSMVARLGTERGVVELAFMVLTLLTHVRLNQLFDEVEITPGEFEELLILLEQGRYPLPEVIHRGPEQTRPEPAHPVQPWP
jgi:hypothetical protein